MWKSDHKHQRYFEIYDTQQADNNHILIIYRLRFTSAMYLMRIEKKISNIFYDNYRKPNSIIYVKEVLKIYINGFN